MANSLTKKSENAYEVAGTLSFKDITKNVLFNANLENNKATAEFLMDTTEFNFNPKLVENNVKIKFSFDI
jgi:polyisoprenoid-binding protein YceI